MATHAVDESQSKAAKVTGFMYLFTFVTANFAEFYVRGQVLVPADAAPAARNIAGAAWLFRLGIACDLLTRGAFPRFKSPQYLRPSFVYRRG